MTEKRQCLFCGSHVSRVHDDERTLAFECVSCLAVEVITKGKGSWWYHGAQQLDRDGAPGDRIDGDRRRISPAPCDFQQWTRNIPPGALSA